MKRWLTTSQMGWALTREENEVVNQKDEREGKPVARQLAQANDLHVYEG